MKKLIALICTVLLIAGYSSLAFSAGAKIRGYDALTTGCATCLDSVDGDDAAVGDYSFTLDDSSGTFYVHHWVGDTGACNNPAENSPYVIRADTCSGDTAQGYWKLMGSIDTYPSSIPKTVFRDLEATDFDDNVYLQVDCPDDFGSNTEDCDFSIYVQIAGAATEVFKIDADGNMTATLAAGDDFNILTGNLKVGNGTPGQTHNGEDAYVEGLLEVDGVIHADGGVTGNASTATALAANGGNCSAGEIPLGVDTAGAVEGCYEPAAADISDLNGGTDITADLEEEGGINATAVTGNPAGAAAVMFSTGVNAAGWDTTPAVDCTDCTNIPAAADLNDIGNTTLTTPGDGGVLCFTGTSNNNVDCTVGGDATATEDAGTLTIAVVDDSHNHTTTSISGVDISDDTNLAAGNALTLTGDSVAFDGGATPAGDLGGTWDNPSVNDDSHNHTTTTISGLVDADHANNALDADKIVGDSTDDDDLDVAAGGTGVSTLADGGLVIGNAAGDVEVVAAGATTEILVGGGASTAPVWTTAQGSGAPVRADSPTLTTPNIGAATGTSLDISGAAGLVLENDETITNSTDGTISFGAANLATSGAIQGAITINSDANGMTQGEMTTAGIYGTVFFATGAGTWNLPAAAAGMSYCVYSTTAAAIIINPDDSDVIVYDGTADTAGHQIASPSAAGDFICMVALDATNWYTLGVSGTWVPGS